MIGGSISVSGVTNDYGPGAVLRGVDIEVAPGEIYGLFGANGSGKSTLIRILTGISGPATGTVRVCGQDVRADASTRRLLGYVAQKFGLYQDLSVEENLNFYARCYGLQGAPLARAVDRTIERLSLGNLRRDITGELSHGWKQRLALAAALCHEPRVLILDEATAGIDPVGRRQLWIIFREFASAGGAILLSTHHLDEAELCSRIGYLADGRVAFAAAGGVEAAAPFDGALS